MSKEIIKDVVTEGAKKKKKKKIKKKTIDQGWTINNTVGALTVIYLLLQIGWLVWRWHKAASGQPVKGE